VYQAHFQLNQEPFSIAPDPSFLFLSKAHSEALAHLMYGFSHGGFVLITGEVGTGKTTLLRNLLKQTPTDLDVAFILNPRLTVRELLETLCQELGVVYDRQNTQSVKQYIDALNRHLLRTYQEGRSTVVIIDEAQNLSPAVLEQVRLLTNLETDEKKLLRIILVGQPELSDMLDRQELRQLAQRITARYHLGALSREDTYAYVAHRLSRAGGRPDLFSAAALRRLYRLSGGVPRIINVIADRALLGAYVENQRLVNARTVSRAAHEVLGKSPRLPIWQVATIVGLVVVGIAAAYLLPVDPLAGTAASTPDTSDPAIDVPAAVNPNANQNAGNRSQAPPAITPDPTPTAGDETGTVELMQPQIETGVSAAPATTPDPVRTARESDDITPETDAAKAAVERPALSSGVSRPDGSTHNTQRQAYAAVFERWGADYASSDPLIPCDFAPSAGLQCLSQYGTWDNIRQSNLPVVLELWDEQPAPYHAALIGMNGGELTLNVGGEVLRIEQRDLRDVWFGAYVILWQTPPGYIGSIRQGDRHETVSWLRQQLAGVSNLDLSSDQPDLFDAELHEAVMQFQRDQGLIIDGVVGPATWIRLSSQLQLPSPGLGT
jgi:general secretion pathway protein A